MDIHSIDATIKTEFVIIIFVYTVIFTLRNSQNSITKYSFTTRILVLRQII
jgi:hypothetical protein